MAKSIWKSLRALCLGAPSSSAFLSNARLRSVIVLAAALAVQSPGRFLTAEEPDFTALHHAYDAEIQPLLKQYCIECHGGESVEGEVDFTTLEEGVKAVQHGEVWQRTNEMLSNGLMPPEDAPQPTATERVRIEAWLQSYLALASTVQSGDPGRVVLRRLSNAEYNYTIQDLTGVSSLTPASEFPGDGAAGEGFTNVGNALSMSPELVTKYLEAGKHITSHTVLLPDGFRFSPHTSRRDWSDELIAEIRRVYAHYTEPIDMDEMNLQGVEWGGSNGGRIPLAKYLAATFTARDALLAGSTSVGQVAIEHQLSPKYLEYLWSRLNAENLAPLLGSISAEWRQNGAADVAALERQVINWQQQLWKFSMVGRLGRRDGPTEWLEPVNPVVSQQVVRLKLPTDLRGKDFVLSLVANDAGDGDEHDFVVWQRPHLVAPGRPELLLRDVPEVTRRYRDERRQIVDETAGCLAALHEVSMHVEEIDWPKLAEQHQVRATTLAAWAEYLGLRTTDRAEVFDRFVTQEGLFGGDNKVVGWGNNATPYVAANPTDKIAEFPGPMRPHGVAMHPSSTQQVAVGWTSPISSLMQISLTLKRALPEVGTGIGWSLELRRGSTRRRLAIGKLTPDGLQTTEATVELGQLAILEGDLVSVIVDSREGHPIGDLTAIEFELHSLDGRDTWNLAEDVADQIFSGNPHSDRAGRAGIWSFYSETGGSEQRQLVEPPGSAMAKWREATTDADRQRLAKEVQELLAKGVAVQQEKPDALLHQQLLSISGPLVGAARRETLLAPQRSAADSTATFGQRPDGKEIAHEDLCVHAPTELKFSIPAELCAGSELIATAFLENELGAEGSVQCRVQEGRSAAEQGGTVDPTPDNNPIRNITDDDRTMSFSDPILVNENTAARTRVLASFAEFRQLFPAAMCYTSVVPHDETASVKLFHRDDDRLVRLVLSDDEATRLDRLWTELYFVSQSPLIQVSTIDELLEESREIGGAEELESMRDPIYRSAEEFRQQLIESESKQLEALQEFASRVFRRPLVGQESQRILALYREMRGQGIAHEEAIRVSLAHLFVTPAFLYRLEASPVELGAGPVSDWELATRLSYFLWSSTPDDELRAAAVSGRLRDSDVLVAQAKRMLADDRTRRLALEFACQWLHIRDFDEQDEKSERHFPTFLELRDDIQEESVCFFTHLFQSNGSILDLIDCDYAFLNEELAHHYGIPNVVGPEWRKVHGVRKFHRGGVLAQASVLAAQSGASRTSPILRGTWISETLLGERLPKPPKGVPPLPEEVDTETLSVRQLVEKHTSDPKCATCHRRIDPYGFSLEAFDAIGRFQTEDHAGRQVDTRVTAIDGLEFSGLAGLRDYILNTRRDAFVRHFCRKLLGFALGRSVQLSDQSLLDDMVSQLEANEYTFATAVEAIVNSRQFREIQGRELAAVKQ